MKAPTPPSLPLVSCCSWCPNPAERTAVLLALGYVVTHGICPTCEAKLHAEIEAAA